MRHVKNRTQEKGEKWETNTHRDIKIGVQADRQIGLQADRHTEIFPKI